MSNKQLERDAQLPKPQPNALAAVSPQLDLVGPTVDDDVRRAIWRYGADAVKDAVKEATKAKRGRKQEKDWPELKEVIQEDAREWLDGNDPVAARSNYAIAKAFSERSPGHSVVSTHKRIERKLSKAPYDRQWFTLISAKNFSRDGYPFAAHLRALEALSKLPEATGPDIWQRSLNLALGTLADYEAREGHPPPAEMSFREIEDAVKVRGLAAGFTPSQRQSVFGSLLRDAVEQATE